MTGTQRRSVGDRAGEHAEDDRQRHVEQLVHRRRHDTAGQHQQHREGVEAQTGDAQRREETGADLNTDGVNEQDQAELRIKCSMSPFRLICPLWAK